MNTNNITTGIVKILLQTLLFLNGISAVIGGLLLMAQPNGRLLHITVAMLRYSPFTSYFLPGMVLFVFNGVSSLLIFYLSIFSSPRYPLYAVAQGAFLILWIMVQVVYLQTFSPLHLVMGVMGLNMAAMGAWLRQATPTSPAS
ncbi:MAG: hypothetical protein HOP08_12365 [Cyclobacteriaceae bacterium]|nr:hypothetical protein [Cyclobacteriaceae bacterium]